MSAGEKRNGATYDEIAAAACEARGGAIIRQIANLDAHAGDLPIRHHVTGRIVAYVPRHKADGLSPIVRDGLVVGYYKDVGDGRLYPLFIGRDMVGWASARAGEEWVSVFSEDGRSLGDVLL